MLTSDSKIPRFLSYGKISYGEFIFDCNQSRLRFYHDYIVTRWRLSAFVPQFDDFIYVSFVSVSVKGFMFCFKDLNQLDYFLSHYNLNCHSVEYLQKLTNKFNTSTLHYLLRLSCEELESQLKFYDILVL